MPPQTTGHQGVLYVRPGTGLCQVYHEPIASMEFSSGATDTSLLNTSDQGTTLNDSNVACRCTCSQSAEYI